MNYTLKSLLFSSGAAFSPASLGEVKVWVRADDATISGGLYTQMNEAGTNGGTWGPPVSAEPNELTLGSLSVPEFTSPNRVLASVAPSAYRFLHDGTGTATLSARFRLNAATGTQLLFGTGNLSTANGFSVYAVSGVPRVRVGNGTAAKDIVWSGSLSAATWHDLQVTVDGSDYGISIDAGTPVTGSVTSPALTDPAFTGYIGSYPSTGTLDLDGVVGELLVHGVVLDSTQRGLVRDYLARWSGVPS